MADFGLVDSDLAMIGWWSAEAYTEGFLGNLNTHDHTLDAHVMMILNLDDNEKTAQTEDLVLGSL